MFHLNFKSMTLYKSKIIYLILGLITFFAIFFIAPQSVDACGVQLNSSFRFRTSAGLSPSQPNNWYDDENRPFVYIDFKRQGECDNTSQMYLTVFGISPNDYLPVKKTIFNYVIDVPFLNANNGEMTLAFKAGEGPCFGALDNSSDSNCFIFAMITDLPTDNSNSKVLGILGNLIADIPQTQASIFADSWGNGATSPNTTNCNNIAGYFYVLNQSCPWVSTAFTSLFSSNHKQKLIDYYNTYSNGGYSVSTGDTPSASIAYPAFFYKCDGFCDPASSVNDEDHWKDVPSGTLPYGTTHPSDQGAVNVNPLPSNYQTEYVPLAPLPFEGLSGGATPSLGEYLASIFRMAIVVIVILAVIMIVFHGIAYATTGAINKKDDHREGVKNAILGLVLALGSWLLLNTISPRLASQLSIGIPMAHLDGPDPAWDNGNAPVGKVISSKALLGGQPIVQGMPWPDDSMQRSQLGNAGISVVSSGNSNCTPTAGTPNCTSVYFDGPAAGLISQIISFKGQCNCEIVITGGSEAWLHSSHGPNKKVVDFRATTSLNEYLNGLPGGPASGNGFPSGKSIFVSGVGKFYAEPSGSTGNTTAKHWHVTLE